MYLGFSERAKKMGLEDKGNGCFHYHDKFCNVVYRELVSKGGSGILDNAPTPYLGIWTSVDNESYTFVGAISDKYQFIGNEAITSKIIDSIQAVGNVDCIEDTWFATNYVQMRHEIVVKNQNNIPNVGTVYPLIVVNNSYNGSKAVDVSFGLHILHNNSEIGNVRFGFQEKLAKIRQVHIVESETSLTSVIGGYINSFSEGILSLIDSNFNQKIENEEMMRVLTLIEKIGKRRRKEMNEYIHKLQDMDGQNNVFTTWKLFLCITRFSSIEQNLNVKSFLENVAESVLKVPSAMIRTVRILEENKQ
jgi:hypothetical protein